MLLHLIKCEQVSEHPPFFIASALRRPFAQKFLFTTGLVDLIDYPELIRSS
jgi:hypothetical protein